MRVLVVDDSHAARMLLAQAVSSIKGLELAGEADFAAHAVEQFRRLKPDLVVLDALLPDGYGVEVLRVIKREAPHCVVAMISNYPLLFESASLKEGADYFIAKLSGLEGVKTVLNRIAADCRNGVSGKEEVPVLNLHPGLSFTHMANVQAQGRCAALSRSVPWSAVLAETVDTSGKRSGCRMDSTDKSTSSRGQ